MKSEEKRIEAWRALLRAHTKVVERIEGDLKAAGLPPLSWYDVLLTLERSAGRRLRMHELASRILLSRSNLTRLADRLERKGLITRQFDPADRRGSFAVLTGEGAALRKRMWPVYRDSIGRHFAGHLSGGEALALSEILGRLAGKAES